MKVGSGTTACSDSSWTRNRWAILASTRGAFIRVNVSPPQPRGPPLKGKYAYGWRRVSRAARKRSGRNRCGSSPLLSVQCAALIFKHVHAAVVLAARLPVGRIVSRHNCFSPLKRLCSGRRRRRQRRGRLVFPVVANLLKQAALPSRFKARFAMYYASSLWVCELPMGRVASTHRLFCFVPAGGRGRTFAEANETAQPILDYVNLQIADGSQRREAARRLFHFGFSSPLSSKPGGGQNWSGMGVSSG